MANPITEAINKAVKSTATGSNTSVPDAKPVASSTLKTTSKSGS